MAVLQRQLYGGFRILFKHDILRGAEEPRVDRGLTRLAELECVQEIVGGRDHSFAVGWVHLSDPRGLKVGLHSQECVDHSGPNGCIRDKDRLLVLHSLLDLRGLRLVDHSTGVHGHVLHQSRPLLLLITRLLQPDVAARSDDAQHPIQQDMHQGVHLLRRVAKHSATVPDRKGGLVHLLQGRDRTPDTIQHFKELLVGVHHRTNPVAVPGRLVHHHLRSCDVAIDNDQAVLTRAAFLEVAPHLFLQLKKEGLGGSVGRHCAQ